jgi:uncharacterized protein with HEPN domain
VRDDRERLLDIRDAIRKIEKYAIKGFDDFSQNELIQVWFTRHLQIIGEAARSLSSGLTDKYPGVPWEEIIGLRNVLVHNYFEIDHEVVWGIVQNDLPPLKKQVESILHDIGEA